MSTLLEQAVIDAQTLKNAAIKNAESTILEKYSHEIKNTVNTLLNEQDMFEEETEDVGTIPSAPGAEGLCPCPDVEALDEEGQTVSAGTVEVDLTGIDTAGREEDKISREEDLFEEIEINFETLEQELLAEEENSDVDISDELLQEIVDAAVEEGRSMTAEPKTTCPEGEELNYGECFPKAQQEEGMEISDELLEKVLEEITVDINPQKSGWTERPTSDAILAIDQAEATEADETLEKNSAINKLNEGLHLLNSENENLTGELEKTLHENKQVKNIIFQLKEKLNETNLSNARLLYANRVLTNSSLNERQKNTIVTALLKVQSVQEAKMVFETLQSTVGALPKRGRPESLSEVVSRNSSTIMPRQQKEASSESQVAYTRMKALAGIK